MELIDKARRFLSRRRTAYLTAFSGPAVRPVLVDLARFCRARTSTFHQDARLHALQEGRREVWLRIQEHLNLSDTEIWNLYNGSDDVS